MGFVLVNLVRDSQVKEKLSDFANEATPRLGEGFAGPVMETAAAITHRRFLIGASAIAITLILVMTKIEESRIRLNAAQGRLQEITLEHFYVMKQHLSPGQGEKLLDWTYQSLTHGHYR